MDFLLTLFIGLINSVFKSLFPTNLNPDTFLFWIWAILFGSAEQWGTKQIQVTPKGECRSWMLFNTRGHTGGQVGETGLLDKQILSKRANLERGSWNILLRWTWGIRVKSKTESNYVAKELSGSRHKLFSWGRWIIWGTFCNLQFCIVICITIESTCA